MKKLSSSMETRLHVCEKRDVKKCIYNTQITCAWDTQQNNELKF